MPHLSSQAEAAAANSPFLRFCCCCCSLQALGELDEAHHMGESELLDSVRRCT